MRGVAGFAALVLAVPGCLGGDDGTPASRTSVDHGSGDDPTSPNSPVVDPGMPAPILRVGQAWTYRATGLYDLDTEVTIVVARADASGYLFAAASEDQLKGEILFGRSWLGHRDLELNRVGPDGSEVEDTLFDFPLEDGKIWTWNGRTVTARVGPVPGPGGTVPGFTMEVQRENGPLRWTYAPSVGFLTTFRSESGARAYFDLTLQAVGTSSTWVWYELLGSVAIAGDVPNQGTLDVSADADAVVFTAGGWGGGAVTIVPPPGGPQPMVHQVPEDEAWTAALHPATAGTWGLAITGAPGGHNYGGLAAVRWVRPG